MVVKVIEAQQVLGTKVVRDSLVVVEILDMLVL